MNTPNARSELKAPQPPTPPAIHNPVLTRTLTLMRGFTGIAGAVSIGVLVAEATLPMPYKPSVLIGSFHGRLEAADAAAKIGPVTALTRKNAEAASQPPAIATMETEGFRQQQQILADSLATQSIIANTGDAACAAARLISPNDRDWGWLGALLSQGCGVGDQVRGNMMSTLRRGGQDNSVLIQRPRAGDSGNQ